MRRFPVRVVLAAMTALTTLVFVGPTSAQIPDEFTNLKVLAKEIAKGELMDVMKGFSMSLGVRCTHCHVGDESKGFASFDFASDEKQPKEAARLMMRMVEAINGTHLAELSGRSDKRIKVQCVTCHRGQAEPRMLEDVLAASYEVGGLDSAAAKYRSLRERFYGSHSYDFSEMTLVSYSTQLTGAGAVQDAIEILKLNVEFNSESAISYYQMGELYLSLGDKESAISKMERALELMPGNPRVANRLAELKG